MGKPELEQEIVEHKVRRAVGLNALRKMDEIVAGERQADAESAGIVRWFVRYGWIVLVVSALLFAYVYGLI
ncbi:MAG: hypothetical protein PHP70_04965 [Gallionella sp.]|nr:hypothetical protein [Gallionella sp.]